MGDGLGFVAPNKVNVVNLPIVMVIIAIGFSPKLLTIYVVDPQGKRVNTAEVPITNDGTFGDVGPFMQLLEMHLVRLGINQASQVLLVADGAEWIWLANTSVTETTWLSA